MVEFRPWFSLSGPGVTVFRPLGAGVSRPVDFLLFRLGDFGRLLVMELLVALIKLEFAALRIGVGRARRMRWEVGKEFAGGEAT